MSETQNTTERDMDIFNLGGNKSSVTTDSGYSFVIDKPSRFSLWTVRDICGGLIVRDSDRNTAIDRAVRILGA
jgi:hypothetical protein